MVRERFEVLHDGREVDHDSTMDAVDCAHAMLARIDIRIVFLVGAVGPVTRGRIAAVAPSSVVAKPIVPHELCRVIVEACAGDLVLGDNAGR